MVFRVVLFFSVLSLPIISNAQIIADQFSGRPIQLVKMDELEGSQFLFNDWKSATVYADSNYVYKNVPILYDVYNKILYFKKDENSFLFNSPIARFDINDSLKGIKMMFSVFYTGTGKNRIHEYVQILEPGKIQVLKFFEKQIDEIYEYNNPVKLKKFRDVNHYKILFNKDVLTIENISKDAQSILMKINPLVTDYVKQNGKIKSPDDLIKAVKFLNSK